jgi:hypothetical protein
MLGSQHLPREARRVVKEAHAFNLVHKQPWSVPGFVVVTRAKMKMAVADSKEVAQRSFYND